MVVVLLLGKCGGRGEHGLTLAAAQGVSSHQVRILRQLAQRQQHHVAIRLPVLGNVRRCCLLGAWLVLDIVFIAFIVVTGDGSLLLDILPPRERDIYIYKKYINIYSVILFLLLFSNL